MKATDDGFLQAEVKAYLIKHGMKQQHFAGLINQSPPMLSYWLKQKTPLKEEVRKKIRQILLADKS